MLQKLHLGKVNFVFYIFTSLSSDADPGKELHRSNNQESYAMGGGFSSLAKERRLQDFAGGHRTEPR